MVDVFAGHVRGELLKVMSVGGFKASIVIGAKAEKHPLVSLIVIV